MWVNNYIFFFTQRPISEGIGIFIKVYFVTKFFNNRFEVDLFRFVRVYDHFSIFRIKYFFPIGKYDRVSKWECRIELLANNFVGLGYVLSAYTLFP